ncbi:MAG: CDP-alcohol phosphatidyltransferase family protein [Candidatus Jordarchaeales archaeon]
MSKYRVRRFFRPAVYWVAGVCANAGLSPNQVTLASLLSSLLASLLLALGHPVVYGLLVFLSGFLDGVDGALARLTGKVTIFGGLFDSLADRYSDVVAVIGFVFWREADGFHLVLPTDVWAVLAAAGFLMVSYVRARGEVEGVQLDVGLAARSERLLILSISSLLYPVHPYTPMVGLVVCCVASHLTAAYRVAVGLVKLKSAPTCDVS